jgi:hypothetical protein
MKKSTLDDRALFFIVMARVMPVFGRKKGPLCFDLRWFAVLDPPLQVF